MRLPDCMSSLWPKLNSRLWRRIFQYYLHYKPPLTPKNWLYSEKTVFVEEIARNKPSRATQSINSSDLPKYASDDDSNTYNIAGGIGNRFRVVDLESIFQLQEINAWHLQFLNAANPELCPDQRGKLYTGKVNHTTDNRICLVRK